MKDKVLQAKQAVVSEIKEKIDRAQAVVLMDYRGLTVDEATELRRQFREAGVEYKVYKNTMMRFAFKEAGLEDFNKNLTGPNSIAFGYDDPVGVAKVSKEFSKTHEKLEIKAGLVEGKPVSVSEIERLAALPSREVLLAQLLGGLNAPIQGFANVLNGTIKGLVVALNAIQEKKAQEA